MDKSNLLATRLKSRREELQLSQKGLADATDGAVTQAQVSKIEKGDSDTTTYVLRKLSRALGVSPLYLMGEIDDPEFPVTLDEFMEEVAPKVKKNLNIDFVSSAGKPVRIPILDRSMSACCGVGFPNGTDIYAQTEDYLDMPSAIVGAVSSDPDKKPFFMFAEGDSMENAGIMDGFMILVNPIETIFDGDSALVEYGVDKNIAVKRVYWLDKCGVQIRSADGSGWKKDFTAEDFELGFIRIIGKVMFTGLKPKRG